MENPYRLVDSRPICESGIFQLREDLVEGPKQKRFTFSVAEVKSGSSILPLTKDGDVYLIREYKYAIGRTSTEVASGAMEQGESPLAAAQRELHEELGLVARRWIELGTVDPFTTQLKSPNHQFLALDLDEVRTDPDEAEVIERVKLKLDEAVRMVLASEITHAPSCTLI
jgi:8-oxo-dGTP pyrophosphatase MutT (NUDIX family)